VSEDEVLDIARAAYAEAAHGWFTEGFDTLDLKSWRRERVSGERNFGLA
jgi:hypothetical protein